jgi:hypothetical protein
MFSTRHNLLALEYKYKPEPSYFSFLKPSDTFEWVFLIIGASMCITPIAMLIDSFL